MTFRTFVFLLSAGFIFYSCSSMESTTRETKIVNEDEEEYVFDEMPSDSIKLAEEDYTLTVKDDEVPLNTTEESKPNFKTEVKKLEPPKKSYNEPTTKSTGVAVQLGAFSTKDKAEFFAGENSSLIGRKTIIKLSKDGTLYVVQVPGFVNRNDAAQYRDKLKVHQQFKDAWIVID